MHKSTAQIVNAMSTRYLLYLYLMGRYTPTPARNTGEQTVIRILNPSNPRLSSNTPREQTVFRILNPSNPSLSPISPREQ